MKISPICKLSCRNKEIPFQPTCWMIGSIASLLGSIITLTSSSISIVLQAVSLKLRGSKTLSLNHCVKGFLYKLLMSCVIMMPPIHLYTQRSPGSNSLKIAPSLSSIPWEYVTKCLKVVSPRTSQSYSSK